jgi:hypothetical protein
VPAQPVDATPSDINLLFKGGVYGPKETDELCLRIARQVGSLTSKSPLSRLP